MVSLGYTFDDAQQVLGAASDAIGEAAADFLETASDHLERITSEAFEDEGPIALSGTGLGAWRRLTKFTKQERAAQGFGEGPILDRSGDLKQLVTSNPMENFDIIGDGYQVSLIGPANPFQQEKLEFAQQGGTGDHGVVPARPVIPVIDSAGVVMMEKMLHHSVEKELALRLGVAE